MKLKEKVKTFPTKPGVYLFKDAEETILYIGKARSIRKRVSSYFKKEKGEGKVKFLLKKARDIDFIVTDNEKEALLLEDTLIKKHKPRYNIELKDDKTYVSIKLSLNHSFPGISIIRRPLKDGAAYFGPYSSAKAARSTIDQIVEAFRIRSCKDAEFNNRVRPCLEFDLGRCSAPCVGKISKEEYLKSVNDTILLLKGSKKEVIKRLKEKMDNASGSQHYEEAARFRDLVKDMENSLIKQKVIFHGGGDQDAVGFARDKDMAVFCVLIMKGGLLQDKRIKIVKNAIVEEEEIILSFLMEYYLNDTALPDKILLPRRVEWISSLGSILADRFGKKVEIFIPKQGLVKELCELANKNAEEVLKFKKGRETQFGKVLENLRRKLNLPSTPEIIDCLDITNILGKAAYGALVSFVNGIPERSRYRLYGIRSIETPDDYSMMQEVIERRFSVLSLRALRQAQGERIMMSNDKPVVPDLLLVDGGKGQLNIARGVLDDLGFSDIPVASIAKADKKKDVSSEDNIYVVNRKNPVKFKKGSPELLLLKKIRDAAHKFGINAHRRKRSRSFFDA